MVHKHQRAASRRFTRKTSPTHREGRRAQTSINGSVAAPTALTSHNSCTKCLVLELMIFGAALARLGCEGIAGIYSFAVFDTTALVAMFPAQIARLT